MNARRTIKLLVLSGVILAIGATGWTAETSPGERKAQFNRLVAKRNRLQQKLHKLDRQAAQTVKESQDPVQTHAEQISTQDQLDLIQLRLEAMAMRHDFVVPPPPSNNGDRQGSTESADQAEVRLTGRVFQRGRQRTLAELRRQTLQMLRSINYKPLLKSSGRK